MAQAESRANAVWHGDLFHGKGEVSTKSGVLKNQTVTWAARAERNVETETTSPEELIAAAHASCFSMALSNNLASNNTPADELNVTATATFVPGPGITTMLLEVTGKVPGISAEDFQKQAEGAKENCPVSAALKGNVTINLKANLAQ